MSAAPRAAVCFTLLAFYVFINTMRVMFCPRLPDECKQGRLRLQPALLEQIEIVQMSGLRRAASSPSLAIIASKLSKLSKTGCPGST